MRKVLLVLLLVFLVTEFVYCWTKETWGYILTIGGVVLALDGYQTIDISDPSLSITGYWDKTYYSYLGSWWTDAWGGITNTGNTNVTSVTIAVGYYDYMGLIVADGTTLYGNLAPGEYDTWTCYNTNCGSWEPTYVQYAYSLTYEKVYGYKSETQGQLGVICAIAGIYLFIESSTGRYSKFMEKHNLEVKFRTDLNYVKVALVKRI